MTHRSLADLGYAPDRYGLLERLLVHRIEQGGTLGFNTGIQGSGKTTWLLRLGLGLIDQGETVIMRGRHVDAWHRFPLIGGDVKVWADHPIEVLRAPLQEGGRAERWDIPIHPFVDTDDLIERAEPGCLNVVYTRDTEMKIVEVKVPYGRGQTTDELREVKTRFWDQMVHKLAHKTTMAWHALIIDEVHEVWHDRPEGEDYIAQGKVRDDLADFRKTYNSAFIASHQPDEVDYRILAKFQFRMHGRGARPHSASRVNPALTLNLSPGELILDSLHFATIRYPAIPIGDYQVFVRDLSKDAAMRWAPPPNVDLEEQQYERAVEHVLDDALQRMEARELAAGASSVQVDGWDVWSCGCHTRRHGERFETRPCREDRSCRIQRFIDEGGQRRGTPTRFEAPA